MGDDDPKRTNGPNYYYPWGSRMDPMGGCAVAVSLAIGLIAFLWIIGNAIF